MSKEVLNTRQRIASILYKLAIRNMQLAYRTLYTEKDRADLGDLSRKFADLSAYATPRRLPNAAEIGGSPVPRLLFLAAARTVASGSSSGGSDAVKVKMVFGPIYASFRSGVSKILISSTSHNVPSSYSDLNDLEKRLGEVFGSTGKLSVLYRSLIREDQNSYRIELTTTQKSSNSQYAIVHNGGKQEGKVIKIRFTNKSGKESYRDAIYPTSSLAIKALSEVATGLPLSSKSVSPQDAASGGRYVQMLLQYEVILLGEEGSPSFDAYGIIDSSLSSVDGQ